jgi:uncharacterized membrane protein YfcA
MIVGSTIGGWWGGFLIRELEPGTLRGIIVAIGVAMGLVMGVSRYL